MQEQNLRTRGRGEQVVLLPLQAEDAVDIVLISNSGNALRSKNINSSSSTGKRKSSCTLSLAGLVLLMGSACFLLSVLQTTTSENIVATRTLARQTTHRNSPNDLLRVKQAATPVQSTSRLDYLLQAKKADSLSLRKEIPVRTRVSASKTPLTTKPATDTKTSSSSGISHANVNEAAKTTKATSSSNNNDVSVAGIDPIACSSFLESVRSETYPVVFRDPNREHLPDGTFNQTNFTRMTLTENPFWISVHHRMADKVRWTMFKEGKYYEWALENLWRDVLKESGPGARVLDVGYVLLVTTRLWIQNACVVCIIVWRVLDAYIDVES
jgi:hypothetical protein